MTRAGSLILAVALLGVPRAAAATWSILAVDAGTDEVGVAGATCVDAYWEAVVLVPGIGAAVVQGSPLAAQPYIRLRMEEGAPARAILAELLRPRLDPQRGYLRQYAIATLGDRPAAFTGNAISSPFSGHVLGDGVTAQGGAMRAPGAWRESLHAFRTLEADCVSLADRLMAGLEAAVALGGDRRCTPRRGARSAALMVARPGDLAEAPYLDLTVSEAEASNRSPVVLLREKYDTWRALNVRCLASAEPAGAPQ